jgi:hypothetical protein
MTKRIVILLLLFLSSFHNFAIPPFSTAIGYGPELIYNLPLSEIGIGARVHIPISNHIFVSPQLNYFIPIGQIHELNLNLHASYLFNPWSKYGLYLTAGPYFNYWINYKQSGYAKAKPFNFAAELGGGAMKNMGCMRPFLEWRYNAKWSESNVRIGLIYFPKICKGRRKCSTYS